MARQLRLSLRRPASHSRDEFVPGESNAAAIALIDSWPAWPGGALVLVGPEGVGKTHLARAWAANVGAREQDRKSPDIDPTDGRPVLLEDADQGVQDEALFHLINLANREGAGLLLTARTPPIAWPTALGDLRSRLNAMTVATMEEPDDRVLIGVLKKLFRERSIRPKDDVYPYLLKRMERSIAGAREIVERLDETDHADIRPVSRVLARQILESDIENLDLFD